MVSRLSTLISCHINNPHMWSQGFLISSSRLLQGSLQSWIFSPTSTDCAGLSCFKEAATSTSLICGLKALMLLKQTPGRQCSVVGTPPHPRLMHWPSLLSIKLPHLNPHHVVSRLLMLLKQTPGRQSSVLELLPNLDRCAGLPCL